MKYSERFALNQYLTKYPECEKILDIIDMIFDKDSRIKIQDPFVEYDTNSIVTAIMKTENEIESQFFPITELVTILDKETVSETLTSLINRKPSSDELMAVCSWLDNEYSYKLSSYIEIALKDLSIFKTSK